MSANINQALIDIEKNLQDLTSAREQVLDVTASSSELALVATELTKKMETLLKAVTKESTSFNSTLDQSREDFDKKLKALTDQNQKALSAFLINLQSAETEIAEKLSKITETASAKTDSLYINQEVFFNDSKKALASYEKSIFKFSEYLSDFNFDKRQATIENKINNSKEIIITGVKDGKIEIVEQLGLIENSLKSKLRLIDEKIELQEVQFKQTIQDQDNKNTAINQSIQKLGTNLKIGNYVSWGLIMILIIVFLFNK